MKYEKVCNCKDSAEAAVILGMFSASGITDMTRDVEQGDIMNVISGTTVFGKEICVPEDQIGQAKELIVFVVVVILAIVMS